MLQEKLLSNCTTQMNPLSQKSTSPQPQHRPGKQQRPRHRPPLQETAATAWSFAELSRQPQPRCCAGTVTPQLGTVKPCSPSSREENQTDGQSVLSRAF